MFSDLIVFATATALAFGIKSLTKNLLWVIPTSMIAGFLVFIGSTEVLGFYKLSSHFSFYIDILLAYIFGSFPLSISSVDKSFFSKVKTLWQYSALQYVSQWGISLVIVILVLKGLFPFLTDQFSVVLPAGFAGGHGSAAVVGDILGKMGFQEALTLTMTMATVGALFSLVGGVAWIYWGRRKGYLENINFDVQIENKKPFYINPKTFIVLTAAIIVAFFLKPFFSNLLRFEIPIFAVTVAVSAAIRFVRPKIKIHALTLEKTTNFSTDFLVLIGIAGIKIFVVELYIWPLVIMSLVGLSLCIIYFRCLGMRVFEEDSFTKAVFTWGWSVGGLVFGLALVKMIKKQDNMGILEQFAFTYLMLAPIEIGLLLSMPFLTTKGIALYAAIPLLLLALILIKILAGKADKVLK